MRLAAPRKWQAGVKMTWQRLPAGETHGFANWQTDLSPTGVAEKQFQVKLKEEGSYALPAAIIDGDTLRLQPKEDEDMPIEMIFRKTQAT